MKKEQQNKLTYMKTKRHIQTLVFTVLLLLAGGMVNQAMAAKVTYHILTLPMNSGSDRPGKTIDTYDGWSTEAIKVTVDNVTTPELPAHYQSPLATNFQYYAETSVKKYGDGTAQKIYANSANTYILYKIKDGEKPLSANSPITSNCDIYVTYAYNASNGIAKLDGSESYNILVTPQGQGQESRFLAYNRGRNNRPASIGTSIVSPEQVSSSDFTKVDIPKNYGITTWWNGGLNNEAEIGSQFYFMFKFQGEDPYNISIMTAYTGDKYFVDNDNNKVRDYYRGGTLFGIKTEKMFFTSDIDVKYTTVYNSDAAKADPTLVASEPKPGFHHKADQTVYNSFALLNNKNSDGYVFMGTRITDNGTFYLKADKNDLFLVNQTLDNASKNYTISKDFYQLKTFNFKVITQFGNTLSASFKLSEYYFKKADKEIDANDIPAELYRKYCDFTEFYKDAACTQKITKYSELGEGSDIYVKYEVSDNIPFKCIAHDADYNTATWYELTDDGSTQESGKKLKWDGTSSTFKNNGASDVYDKLSEFAFVGDPYELKVLYRNATETSGSKSYVTLNTYDSWDIPEEEVNGSFLLRKYNDTGYWYWNATAGEAQSLTYNGGNATHIKVMELPTRTYTYKMVDKEGRIAVAASAEQPIFMPLSAESLPSVIVSPFLTGESVTFYDAYTDNAGRSTLTGHEITQTPIENHNIFVKYTTTDLKNKPITLSDDQEFFVKLNGKFIYYDADDNSIKTSDDRVETENKYKWKLRNRDPYAMLIDNLEARADLEVPSETEPVNVYDDDGGYEEIYRQKGAWVNLSAPLANDLGLTFATNRSTAQRFIAKSSLQTGVYEVMVAAGAEVDASTTYYNIGRPGENTVKVYNNTNYAHGNDVIRFNLEQTASYTYHLIDKAKHELLTVASKSPELALPAEYQSPLVSKYHYYTYGNMTITTVDNKDEYVPTNPTNELASIAALYATYATDDCGESDYTSSPDAAKKEATSPDDMNNKAKLLESTGDYYFKVGENEPYSYKKVSVDKAYEGTDIYVTYDKNNLVNFNDPGSPYMLRFLNPFAEGYYLEDGNDKLTENKIKAMYPYTNGDGCLYMYGEDKNKEQMEGGANTRPRWVWFFESDDNDPYHVKIHSKSTILYKEVANPTYLQTFAVKFNQDDELHVVTGGNLAGISSVHPTEYMILGSEHNYKLLTTDAIHDGDKAERRYVTSMEQYWRTYNMIKLYMLGIPKSENAYSDDKSTWVVPNDLRDDLASALNTKGIGEANWHSYDTYLYATRWNGYNDKSSGLEKKVAEKLEHWFQTFELGDGSFDIESANIPPVLILLDRHGWEIMRKPLPKQSTYPYGDELAELKIFDSPLVEKYHFYSNAKKALGCHKYSLRKQDGKLRDEIKVGDTPYTSTSLASLPPITATGVLDNAGILQDQYVTYTVKEEYEKSYQYNLTYETTKDSEGNITNITYTETGTPSKFLVVQNARFAKLANTGALANPSYISKPVFEHTNPTGGSAYDMILNPLNAGGIDVADAQGNLVDNILWYVQPNLEIDDEMGIKWSTAYENADEPFTKAETKIAYKDQTGFDPYNLQLKNADNGTFFTMNQATATLKDGIWEGTLTSDGITLAAQTTEGYVQPEGYDHTTLKITKQTFMAVQDDKGNMQLMPRFLNTKRIGTQNSPDYLTQLEDPDNFTQKVDVTEGATAQENKGHQTTFFVRPVKYVYHIIDNEGNEALNYKSAGENYPYTPDHFKSPFATNFGYYKTKPTYNPVTKTLEVNDSISGSFAGAGLNDLTNNVYVRYAYNEENDEDGILKGKWFTINLADKNVQSSGAINPGTGEGVSLYADAEPATKPSPVDSNAKKWQWKFLMAPTDATSEYYEAPDPYAVKIFNREANNTNNPTAQPNPMATGIKVNGTDRFAILSHPNGGYALATASSNTTSGPSSYYFLNGENMTAPSAVAATTSEETGFTLKANTITSGAQLLLTDEVQHDYTYHVITNNSSGNKLAISGTQSGSSAQSNSFVPTLPSEIKTPLLNMEDYTYYGNATVSDGAYTVLTPTKLSTLYGLYNDEVFVRYGSYDPNKTEYLIPNKKDIVDGKVARHAESNDVALNLEGKLPYNIIWENDNMMKATDSNSDGVFDQIGDDGSQALSGAQQHVWELDGNDPYAIQIKHRASEKYVVGTNTLSSTADKTFMLLNKSGYDYGILQETGGTNKLTGYGQTLTTGDADPTKFILFGLSTHKLIYHLIIANINSSVNIPYREAAPTDGSVAWKNTDIKEIEGTTQRDLTSIRDENATNKAAGDKYQLGKTMNLKGAYVTYCYDAGQISIGDVLRMPAAFYRPNCSVDYYIEGIYDDEECTETTECDELKLNNKYKGLIKENLMSDEGLIGKTVLVNIVYSFDKSLATNSGTHFVKSYTDNLWYTFETQEASVPWLARYTNTQKMTAISGRETHYTNDYLFTPVGDVYGFKMYNRYVLKNSSESTETDDSKVMTTPTLNDGETVDIAVPANGYEVYELLTGDTDGFFHVHPVVNYNDGTTPYTALYVNMADNKLKLSTTPRDWTYGLDLAMLQPYYLGAGNVGGLTTTPKTGQVKSGKQLYEEALATKPFLITDLQDVVYNDNNIVDFAPGCYRLHSQPGISGISPIRYLSGYLHDIEQSHGGGLPMHFYSKQDVSTTFEGEGGLTSGFTESPATRGEIPVPATEYDPSTIFHITGTNLSTNHTISNVTLSTQGLNVIENKMGTGTATEFKLMDVGGGIVILYKDETDGVSTTTRYYLTFDQNEANKYDIHYKSSFRIDDVKWCMEPADNLGLMVTTNNGGDGHYYTTFYAPFDVKLPDDSGTKTYEAYYSKRWIPSGIHVKRIEGGVIPASTPVIIRTTDNTEKIKLSFPTESASAISDNIFSGSYLEKLLPLDSDHDVYTLGLPFISSVEKDTDYDDTGNINAPVPEQDTENVGFYINATPNKELNKQKSMWYRNNRYILHNKIYYRGTTQSTPGSLNLDFENTEYIPVLFDDQGVKDMDLQPDGTMRLRINDGRAYDIQGRCVATEQEVSDGSWLNNVASGMYIVNGKKFVIE